MATVGLWLMVAAVIRPEIGWDFVRAWAYALTVLCVVSVVVAAVGYTLREEKPIPSQRVWGMGISFVAALIALSAYSGAQWGGKPNWIGLFGFIVAVTVAWLSWVLPITLRQLRIVREKR